ncbi:glycosyltransferase family 39 protein [Chloroflexota bacterium]
MAERVLAQPRSGWRWFASYLLPISITLLAMALYLYGLESKSLWFDELGTLTGAGWGGSWEDAIRNPLTIPTTPKPPLSYLTTRLFMLLGDSVFLLRLPAALFATLTIPLVFVLGRSFFDGQTGLLGAFLLAIAPLHLRYAQEARMYAMLTFLSILSLYLFWRAIRSRRARWWVWFAVVAVLALYTHLFAALILGVMALFALCLLVRPRGRPRFPFHGGHFVLATAVILLAYAPMAPFVVRGLVSVEGFGGEAKPGWGMAELLATLRLFSGGNDVGLVVYACLFGLAVVTLVAKDRQVLTLTAMWIALPVIFVLVLPFGHAVRVRYFLSALPVYLLLVAYGLRVATRWLAAWAGRRPRSANLPAAAGVLTAVLLLGLLAGIAVPSMAAYYAETKQDWRQATRLVHSLAVTGEPIFVRHPYHQVGVLYYAHQLAGDTQGWTEANVQILPRDLEVAFPPDRKRRSWLVVPLMGTFLTDGDFEVRIRPHYRLLSPILLPPSRLPKESWIISPPTFRTLAVIPVVPYEPPSIRFWADDYTLNPGECTWLRWEVDRVREVYLDGEGVVGHDQRQVCPRTKSRYELQFVEMDGSVQAETVEIEVSAP